MLIRKGTLMPDLREEALKWRSFDHTVKRLRHAFADLPPRKLQSIIDEAVNSVRKHAKKSASPQDRRRGS